MMTAKLIKGWEKAKNEDPDDEPLPQTPQDVVAVLGFDPAKLFSDDESEPKEQKN